MLKKLLEAQIVSLREELDRERKKCNYFRLERDKIHGFWEISKERLDDFKCELSNKYKKIEEAEESHKLEIKQLSITELRAEGEVSNKLLLKKHEDLESDLRKDVQNLKVKLKETELSNKNLIKSVKLKHNEEMTDIRTYFEQLLQDIEAKYENKMVALRQEEDIRRMNEIEMIEQRDVQNLKVKLKETELSNKNLIKSVKLKHNEEMTDIRTYFEQLLQDIEMAKVLRENKQLTEPLRMATEEATVLRKQLTKAEESHKLEIKAYKQKVKHLLYEHQLSITELRKEGEVTTTKLQLKKHEDLESDLWKGIQNLKVKLKEEELSSKYLIKNMEAKYENKMVALRQEEDIRRVKEIEIIELNNNSHISKLMQNHEKALSDIKTYYEDITSNNLTHIKALKKGEREMKEKKKRLKSEMAKLLRERQLLQNYNADKHLIETDKEINETGK
uniref:Dynein regulatory complex subunit 4 n=1 Tax=Astyanax mexicanus TaxID=7994 RepID=A0A8B9KYL0_ASTMX